MGIRLLEKKDIPQLVSIWNEAAEKGEVVLSPMTEQKFHQKFEGDPNYDPALSFVWEEDGAVVGFVIGMAKKIFLPGETYENTPGLLTCIFVRKAYRGRGIGQALVRKLEDLFRESGKKVFACNGDANPIDLDWIVPGTPGMTTTTRPAWTRNARAMNSSSPWALGRMPARSPCI